MPSDMPSHNCYHLFLLHKLITKMSLVYQNEDLRNFANYVSWGKGYAIFKYNFPITLQSWILIGCNHLIVDSRYFLWCSAFITFEYYCTCTCTRPIHSIYFTLYSDVTMYFSECSLLLFWSTCTCIKVKYQVANLSW